MMWHDTMWYGTTWRATNYDVVSYYMQCGMTWYIHSSVLWATCSIYAKVCRKSGHSHTRTQARLWPMSRLGVSFLIYLGLVRHFERLINSLNGLMLVCWCCALVCLRECYYVVILYICPAFQIIFDVLAVQLDNLPLNRVHKLRNSILLRFQCCSCKCKHI